MYFYKQQGFFMLCFFCTMLMSARSTLPLYSAWEWSESQRHLSSNPRSAICQPWDLTSPEEMVRMKGKNAHDSWAHITDHCSMQQHFVCLSLPSVGYISMHSCNKYLRSAGYISTHFCNKYAPRSHSRPNVVRAMGMHWWANTDSEPALRKIRLADTNQVERMKNRRWKYVQLPPWWESEPDKSLNLSPNLMLYFYKQRASLNASDSQHRVAWLQIVNWGKKLYF